MTQVAAPADEPQFEALHARCRAAGVDLMRGSNWYDDPIFLVVRWEELPTLLAVENWLEVVTGKGRPDA